MAGASDAAEVSRKRHRARPPRRRATAPSARGSDLVDFSDQMRFGARLAEECPEVGPRCASSSAVVLLDEYQDTSVAQRRLLTGLFGGGHPVTAVGDPLQAIYGWRGASVRQHRRLPAALPARLRAAGHRCSRSRRTGARAATSSTPPTSRQPLRALHPEVAALVAADRDKPPGRCGSRLHEHVRRGDRPGSADRVARGRRAGTAPGDIALLVRAAPDFPALMAPLGDRDVPFEVAASTACSPCPRWPRCSPSSTCCTTPPPTPRWCGCSPGRAGASASATSRCSGDEPPRSPAARAVRTRPHVDEQLDDAVAGIDPADVVSLLDALDDPGGLPTARSPSGDSRRSPRRSARCGAACGRPAARPRPPGRHGDRSRHRAGRLARAPAPAPRAEASPRSSTSSRLPGRRGRVVGRGVPVLAAPRGAVRQGARARPPAVAATPCSS